jgi:hypothetical protein
LSCSGKAPTRYILDDINVAIKAVYDRVVSASTLKVWLKNDNFGKIEQLAKTSGQT